MLIKPCYYFILCTFRSESSKYNVWSRQFTVGNTNSDVGNSYIMALYGYQLAGYLVSIAHIVVVWEPDNYYLFRAGPSVQKGGASTKKGVNVSRYFPFFKNIVTKL